MGVRTSIQKRTVSEIPDSLWLLSLFIEIILFILILRKGFVTPISISHVKIILKNLPSFLPFFFFSSFLSFVFLFNRWGTNLSVPFVDLAAGTPGSFPRSWSWGLSGFHLDSRTPLPVRMLHSNKQSFIIRDAHCRRSPVIDLIKIPKDWLFQPPQALGPIKIKFWWSRVPMFLWCCGQACYISKQKSSLGSVQKTDVLTSGFGPQRHHILDKVKWPCIVQVKVHNTFSL